MASSKMEFYRRDDYGKINIDWHGYYDNCSEEVFDQICEALKLVNKALIVAHCEPNTASTCLRFIYNIVQESKLTGVEIRVVLPQEFLYSASFITGFDDFYKIFQSDTDALRDLRDPNQAIYSK